MLWPCGAGQTTGCRECPPVQVAVVSATRFGSGGQQVALQMCPADQSTLSDDMVLRIVDALSLQTVTLGAGLDPYTLLAHDWLAGDHASGALPALCAGRWGL